MAAAAEDTEAAMLGRRYVEEFLNTGDESVATELLDESVVAHQLGVEVDRVGRDTVVEGILGFREAVPDWELQVEDVVADGDRVMLRITTRGTPERPWGKLVPTGKSFEAAAFFAFRVDDGRIVEQWNLVNLAGIGRQLGLMPPTPRALVAMARHRLFG
jgi:predicted ester cyclase